MDKLQKRTEESMKESGWTDEQIKERLEDQEIRDWLYSKEEI